MEQTVQQLSEQLATLANQNAILVQQVQQQQAAMNELQQNYQKGAGKGFGVNTNATRLGIDARQLGRPDKFDSSDAKFKDWSIVFRSYASLANSEIAVVMKSAELGEPVSNAELSEERRQASVELYHLLLNLCTGTAFNKVVNSGESEGGLAWKAIIERWDPKMRTRQAGILLSVLKWSFAGDILSRIEEFE